MVFPFTPGSRPGSVWAPGRPLHVAPAELYALVMSVATKQVTEGQVATLIRERWGSR